MSHDFLVATRKQPKPKEIDVFVRSGGVDVNVSGVFRPGSNALVTRVDRTGERTIDVDGPVRVELDDLPEDLAGAVSRAGWLVEIHVPGGYDEVADRWALELAIHLARAAEGAVFDPQTDRIAWPGGVTPRRRGSTEERIRTVDLDWFIAADRMAEDAPQRWLDLVSTGFPPALPVRFGEFEPFQHRLELARPDGFAAAWQAQAAKDFGGHLFWSAKAPGLHGAVSFSDRREDRRPDRLGRVVRLSTSIDGRPLYRDPSVCEALVEFFAQIAEEFGAAYAAGCVLRDAIIRRGRVWSDSLTEWAPLPRSPWWVGLPALPTWLAWFGEPYRDLVIGVLDARDDAYTFTTRSSGLLLRCSAEPADVDQLRSTAPELPAELLAVRRTGSAVDPNARISMVLGPPSEPAVVIPALGRP